jgi:hypothetical protein
MTVLSLRDSVVNQLHYLFCRVEHETSNPKEFEKKHADLILKIYELTDKLKGQEQHEFLQTAGALSLRIQKRLHAISQANLLVQQTIQPKIKRNFCSTLIKVALVGSFALAAMFTQEGKKFIQEAFLFNKL